MALLLVLMALSACHRPEPRSSQPASPPPPPPPPPLKPLPAREPGLWQTTLTETGSVEPPQVLKICIDARTDKHLGVLGNDLSGDTCTQKGYRPQGDGSLGFLAECRTGQGVVTQYSGSIDGDYTRDYSMKVRLQTTGANLNRVASYLIVSKRIGPCASDQKPGDLISDGVRINLFDMAGLDKDKAKSKGGNKMPQAAPAGD
jgi:hypothetical protein